MGGWDLGEGSMNEHLLGDVREEHWTGQPQTPDPAEAPEEGWEKAQRGK